jgi:hypothetical protein
MDRTIRHLVSNKSLCFMSVKRTSIELSLALNETLGILGVDKEDNAYRLSATVIADRSELRSCTRNLGEVLEGVSQSSVPTKVSS